MDRGVRAVRRHVLIIEPAGQLWGSERALLDLISHISKDRWRITVAIPRNTPLESALSQLPVTVITGPIGMLHKRGVVARALAAAWLAKLVLVERPDVIHLNQAGLARVVGLARLGSRTPLVAHVRLLEDALKLRGRHSRLFPDAYVAISRFIHETLANGVGSEPVQPGEKPREIGLNGRIRFIYDPFDVATFDDQPLRQARQSVRGELGLSDSDRLVILVGRICREKGQDLFLNAARLVASPRVYFLIVGTEPPESEVECEFAESVRKLAATPTLTNKVYFLGERSDVGRLLKASDVAVLASRGEPLGRVLLEALALEIPVVGPNFGGPIEILGSEERGFVFEAGDAASLAHAVDSALSDRPTAQSRARKGAQWVRAMCSPQLHAHAIESLWTEVTRR